MRQVRRVGELTHNVVGVLLGMAVVFDPLVSSHGVERWSIDTASGQHPLTLHEQHVTQVAAVLEG